MTGFEDGRRAKAKEYRQPLESGKVKENRFSSRDSRKEHSLANTFTLALWDAFQASDVQNCKIDLCWFKPLCLWWFITVAIENWYTRVRHISLTKSDLATGTAECPSCWQQRPSCFQYGTTPWDNGSQSGDHEPLGIPKILSWVLWAQTYFHPHTKTFFIIFTVILSSGQWNFPEATRDVYNRLNAKADLRI